MFKDQVEGKAESLKGKAQSAAGEFFEDEGMQGEGKIRQVAGEIQSQYGEKLDSVREATIKNPISALAIAGGVGVFLGILLGRK